MSDFYIADGTLVYLGLQPETLEEAWDISIHKWRLLTKVTVFDNGTQTCGLCMLYFGGRCHGCPITNAGHRFCEGTPYDEYDDIVAAEECDEARDAAAQELAFLLRVRNRR